MAVPAATTQTHSMIGMREDLSDIIYDISPMDTPFLTQAKKAKANAVFHEWGLDSLAAAATNQHIEGDDSTANTFTATTRPRNYCQISKKTVSVSGTAKAVNTAGRADEESYQIAKRGKELKRDMEYALTRNQASTAGATASARSLASVESWLATNYVTAQASDEATTPGYSSGTVVAPTDASTAGSFTEARLKTAISNCWTQGGDPTIVMLGVFNKKAASAFSGIATIYRDQQGEKQGTIIGAADLYVSDFGTHHIIANRFSRDQTALVLDMDYWCVAYLREFKREELAKTGDSEKSHILCEFTLVSKNEAASAKVSDLLTA